MLRSLAEENYAQRLVQKEILKLNFEVSADQSGYYHGYNHMCAHLIFLQEHLYDPDINRIYQDMADHYQVAIVPARVRSPKDKSKGLT